MSYTFYFDQTRCTGCHACVVACKDWNLVRPGPVSYRVYDYEETDGKSPYDFKVRNFTHGCFHCAKPACVDACPSGAISKDIKTGRVTIDRNACSGAEACLSACPYGNIYIADDRQEPEKDPGWKTRHPAQKCSMCPDRISAGKSPACVDACPQRALDFGAENDLKKRYGTGGGLAKELGSLLSYESTAPSILCKPKK